MRLRNGIPAAAAGLLILSTMLPAAESVAPHVRALADPSMEGRLTGSAGETKAAEYITARLKEYGAVPLPGDTDMIAPFSYTAGMEDGGTELAIRRDGAGDIPAFHWTTGDQVQALSFSSTATVTAPVVFAGYGLHIPETQGYSYDSYVGLDVKDKIVLVLRYSPEDVDQDTRNTLARYSGLRYKAMHARELGAAGMLVVAGPNSAHAGETIPMSFDAAAAGSDIATASISGAVAKALFDAAGKDLAAVQKDFDSGNPHIAGFDIPGITVTLDAKVNRETKQAHNVLAMLPATVADAANSEHILLCAHYDHLGRGMDGNSLAKKEERGDIHHGADDNASGTAAVLGVAQRLAAIERKRPVVFALWSGEEMGLLGSADFMQNPPLPKEQIAAVINMDMVGRMKDNKLIVQSVGSSPVWPRLIEQANVVTGLDLVIEQDPYLPTDSTTFYQAGIPALNLFTGSHEDYHRPSDTADKINYPGLEGTTAFATLIARKLVAADARPEYAQVDRTWQPSQRDSLRAYTGTIPDYGSQVEGLRLSGVVGGGPADKAGMREGDVIVKFAGNKIANIYDYTYALDSIKPDEPVKVVVTRDGKEVELTVTPTRR